MTWETQIILEPFIYLLVVCTTWMIAIMIPFVITGILIFKQIDKSNRNKNERDLERIKQNTKLAKEKLRLNKDDRIALSEVSDKDLLDEVFRRNP